MNESSSQNLHVGFLKSLGHETRTLLNGITGPVQIIRSLSDDSRLIEPLRILELSVSRIDKFSFRSLLLVELIMGKKLAAPKRFDFIDVFRYISLDLNDLNDFYNVKFNITNDKTPISVECDYELLYQSLLVLLERVTMLSNEGSIINVDFAKPSIPECTIASNDNGLINRVLHNTLIAKEYPSDVDLYLFKISIEMLKIEINLSVLDNKSVTTIKLPSN